ncbi:phospholipid methyltransferase-domain-containing protein [Dipodascopsis tothii]|uniref:phospholipid methyltransferase-domain-containing protein n=1 Tax=Dipodascopsis tothii TaxID=44089 RepID=UPI0034CFD706
MVKGLFDVRQPKSTSDLVILSILTLYVALWVALPKGMCKYVFIGLYALSRAAYNGGIGWLLYQQSTSARLVHWAKRWDIFAAPAATDSSVSRLAHGVLRRELESKMGPDYDFDKVPVEYNTWLLFRKVVDLILMSDFVTYMLFALSCASVPAGQSTSLILGRWAAGVGLFLFNLWVKLDAHRVVKDYAWYWGDFFFLEDLELCFDGIFEIVPHPMYSVGYAGYYGISLITASYTLLAVSLIAHASQFVFLFLVENPHIAKTYYSSPEPAAPAKTQEAKSA